MSLLTDSFEPFIMLDRHSERDNYGSVHQTWTEDAVFEASAVFDTSVQARTGGVQGLTSLYTIMTGRGVNLQYHDVVRRQRDGKVFRVTFDGDDKATPKSASLDLRLVTAEEWELSS